MKQSIITIAGFSLLTFGITGCVSGLQGTTYSRSEARQVQNVEFGTVLSTNPVVIEGK
jgi:outer membrane lipoprotein SlyB